MKKRSIGIIGGILVSAALLTSKSIAQMPFAQLPDSQPVITNGITNPEENLDKKIRKDVRSNLDLVVCNGVKDLDNNGELLFPMEYFGIKNNFLSGETLSIAARSSLPNQVGKELELRILGPNQNVLLKSKTYVTSPNIVYMNSTSTNNLLNKCKAGEYSVVATLNGVLVGREDFKVGYKHSFHSHHSFGYDSNLLDLDSKGFRMLFCNYSKDFDHDGAIKYPDEYVGEKDRFRVGESIQMTALARNPEQVGKKLLMEIYDSRGNRVFDDDIYLTTPRISMSLENVQNIVGIGKYVGIAKINGVIVGRKDFEIKL